MEYKGLHLDEFQEKAIASVEHNHSVVVSAPTGSGKTLIADYIIGKEIGLGKKVIYTAPIKALSNQKYKEFSHDFGESNIGLMTGDIVKNPGAPILIMTTEIYRNMAITQDSSLDAISYVIFDEIHYINDVERGYVWEESIIFSKESVRFLCLSATIPNAEEFASWIATIKKHPVDVIKHDKRPIPLHKHFFDAELGVCTLDEIREIANVPSHNYVRGKSHHRKPKTKAPSHVELVKEIRDRLPCFFFTFSRQKCQDFAKELMSANLFSYNAQISTYIREKLANSPPEINSLPSTQILRQTLPYGIGFHHAGLLPIIKELVEELFSKSLINVLYTTETFAVGINMPAKSVCFESMRKFDGISFRFLNSKEYFQIAGRAGRRGIDKEGHVFSMVDRRDFNYKLLHDVTTVDKDPIKSQFRLGVNTVLNLIKRHPEEEIEEILKKNFYTYQKYGKSLERLKRTTIFHTYASTKEKLLRMGYLKDDRLTEKGDFASNIYSDEILTTEIFGTEFYLEFNEYQTMLLIAAICYEAKERTEFGKVYLTKELRDLQKGLSKNEYLHKERRFKALEELTALLYPCYNGKNVFEIIRNTSLLEGDIIRFFRQMIDRIGQIRKATKDVRLIEVLKALENHIDSCMQNVDMI